MKSSYRKAITALGITSLDIPKHKGNLQSDILFSSQHVNSSSLQEHRARYSKWFNLGRYCSTFYSKDALSYDMHTKVIWQTRASIWTSDLSRTGHTQQGIRI